MHAAQGRARGLERASALTEWACHICGVEHDDLPTCFGIEAPWRALVLEDEFDRRVELTADQCVVDEEHFFVRGHIQIPIIGHDEPLAFSVWSSLSKESFGDMVYHWNNEARPSLPPYFGWLCTPIWVFPDSLHLPLEVRCREPGLTPLFQVTELQHPLALAQREGVSKTQWHDLAVELLG